MDIYTNRFVRKLIANGTEIFKKDPLTAKDIFNFRHRIQSREKRRKNSYVEYNSNVHSSFSRIVETLDDLRATQIFLRQYPYPKTLGKNKISRSTYAIYHIEMYFLKTASLRDKLAILINDVYRLGLPEKRVSVDLLSEMSQLKKAECILLLKTFSKSLNGIASQRNLIAHRTKYDDQEISEIKCMRSLEIQLKILSSNSY